MTNYDADDEGSRLDRELHELIEELRALIPGAEVLFGFLLAIRFTAEFKELDKLLERVYYGAIVATAVSLVLLLAPATFHRLRFREGDKEALLRKGNREAIAGSLALGLALTGALFIITDLLFSRGAAIVVAAVFFVFAAWRWWGVALMRKADDDGASSPG
jgi:hypothetical protein